MKPQMENAQFKQNSIHISKIKKLIAKYEKEYQTCFHNHDIDGMKECKAKLEVLRELE